MIRTPTTPASSRPAKPGTPGPAACAARAAAKTAGVRVVAFAALLVARAPAVAGLAPVAAAALVPAPAAAQQRSHPFQQGVDYRIEAFQDDRTNVLRGRARLRYTNHAPGALDRLYFHQYLNAFRPNSAWTAYDLRFGDSTFQKLGPADHAFERLVSFTIDGAPVTPVYPGAPDSTVFFVDLPSPLAPGDSLEAVIDWTARLATEPRRQGRRGRHYDWAHWYPRIAVYGPDGWEYRAHIRPGELNGNFGRYDVTLELPADQVVGATGVPVEGDPGWAAAAVEGSQPPLYLRDFYGRTSPDSLGLLRGEVPAGRKRIRWRAAKVHNFAWSTSPAYRYLGGRWNGRPIHLLWEPSSEGWNARRTLEQEKVALDWIEDLFGEYPWPQITVTDRVEGGATEFPMLYMTSGGAVTHETMHMIAHGVLANNEWREGWLDEGMATFLTSWLAEAGGSAPEGVWHDMNDIARLDALGRSEPVGLPGAAFSSYSMYSMMTYTKGSVVLKMLRDMLGEDTFRRGLRKYYEDNKFHQVTRADFRAAMEAVSGRDLGWFFHEWLDTTDTLDYAIDHVAVTGSPGHFTLTARVRRDGEAWMPVIVQAGGERVLLDSRDRVQEVRIPLAERPRAVVVDPDLSVLDSDRSNNRSAVR